MIRPDEDRLHVVLARLARIGFVRGGHLGAVKLDQTQPSNEGRKKLQIPHWMLLEADFNIHENMGRLLREVYTFDRRTEAPIAYYDAFKEDRASHKQLKDILDSCDLQWLAYTRNLLIHDAGIVDEKFRHDVSGHPEFGGLVEADDGKPLSLKGDIVAALLSGAEKQGMRLISFVDEWLKNHPK